MGISFLFPFVLLFPWVHESRQLEVVKQEMTRVNIDILGISELKWTGMDEFNSDYHYINYCGQESLRRNGVAIIVNKKVQNAVLGCNLKNDRMISVCFQGKPFNITVIQVYLTKIMASGPITSWEIDGETMETVSGFIFGGSKNNCRW